MLSDILLSLGVFFFFIAGAWMFIIHVIFHD